MTKPLGRPLSAKRQAEIQKSWDEYYIRMKEASWQDSPSADWPIRLAALTHFRPGQSPRQLHNLVKLNHSAASAEPITLLCKCSGPFSCWECQKPLGSQPQVVSESASAPMEELEYA